MKLFRTSSIAIGALAVAALGFGCAVTTDTEMAASTQAAATQDPQLNLSHIECNEDGTVNAHFVLLFAGSETPGTLSGTWSGGSFGPVEADKLSGNVWHYNVTLPSGYIDIYSAETTTSWGALVTLHNPEEYTGDYVCGPTPQCPITRVAEPFCSKPLGSPLDECAAFGLKNLAKDDSLSGYEYDAQYAARLVIVKGGNGGRNSAFLCPRGESMYNVYEDVTVGQPLTTPNSATQISHVTYCVCPPN